MKLKFARACAAALALALARQASAQAGPDIPCASREVIVERLEVRYGETLHGAGVRSLGARIELFASPEGGTWTLLISLPDGAACVVDAGTGWTEMVPVKRGTAI